MNPLRIGVVNWDASLPPDTYFGMYTSRTLCPQKYRSRTPFYADIINENKIEYHSRSLEEFEKELQYAIDAKIDYFAYVWYPEEGSRSHIQSSASDCSHRVYELNYARRMHMQSALRSKIGLCAIAAAHSFSNNDILELVNAMKEECYEKYNGKPLLYVYKGYDEDFIQRIIQVCQQQSVEIPYFVIFCDTLESGKEHVDALSRYCHVITEVSNWESFIDQAIDGNQDRIDCGYPTIPVFSMGWNPAPRLETLVPWYQYEQKSYFSFKDEEYLKAGQRFAQWLQSIDDHAMINHILTFAWNEFEEGAHICPTYNSDLTINTDRVRIFKEMTEIWKTSFSFKEK